MAKRDKRRVEKVDNPRQETLLLNDFARRENELFGELWAQQRNGYMATFFKMTEKRLGLEGDRLYTALMDIDRVFAPQFAAAGDDGGLRHLTHGRYTSSVSACVTQSAHIQNLRPPGEMATLRFLAILALINLIWQPEHLGVEGEEYRVGRAYDPANDSTGTEMDLI
jgi:hypothetical protein